MTLLAVTAQAMPDTRERVFASGFDDYVLKPIEVPTFLQTILDAVQRRSLLERVPQTPAPAPEDKPVQSAPPTVDTATPQPPSTIEASTPTQSGSKIGDTQ